MVTKRYIKIDGQWHRVYTKHDWYDYLCWALAAAMLVYTWYVVFFRGLEC